MDTWEYKWANAESPAYPDDLLIKFNRLGAEGWELVGWNYGKAWFKRKKVE